MAAAAATKSAAEASSTRCLVYCRLRPSKPDEFAEKGVFPLLHLTPRSVTVKDDKTYDFDGTFGAESTQEEVFTAVGRPCVDHALNGFRAAVMCYGQTGTGKSHTLCNTRPGAEGVVPRCAKYLFDHIAADPTRSYQVEGQFIQIYRDNLGDLMTDSGKEQVGIVCEKDAGVTLPGCSSHVLQSAAEFMQLFETGYARRVTTATAMNPESSRGHAALLVWVTSKKSDDPTSSERCGKVTFIDLAGYERFSKTGISNANAIMKDEAKTINASLLSLGHVVTSLSNGDRHVPWRNAKLTRLLQDSIGGRSRTTIILTVGPSSDHLFETTNTLQFGQRAMAVKVQAKATEVVDFAKLAAQLRTMVDARDERIAALELQLASHAAVHEDIQSCHMRDMEQLRMTHEAELEELRKAGASPERIDSCVKQQEIETENMISQQREELEYHAETERRESVSASIGESGLDNPAAVHRMQEEVDRLKQQLAFYAHKYPDDVTTAAESASPTVLSNTSFGAHSFGDEPATMEQALAQVAGLKAIRNELHRRLQGATLAAATPAAQPNTTPQGDGTEPAVPASADESLREELSSTRRIMQAELDAQQGVIQQLRASLDAAQQRMADATGAQTGRARRATTVGDSIERLTLQNELLREQLEATRDTNRALGGQLAELREQLFTAKKELSHAQDRAASEEPTTRPGPAASSTAITDLTSQNSLLKDEVSRLTAVLKTKQLIAEQQEASLMGAMAEAESHERALRDKLAAAEKELETTKERCSKSSQDVAELRAELEVARAESDSYIMQLAAMQATAADTEAAQRDAQKSTQEMFDIELKKARAAFAAERESLENQLRAAVKDAQVANAAVAKAAIDLSASQEKLRDSLRDRTTAVDELKAEVARQLATIETLKHELTTSKETNSDFEIQVATLQATVAKLNQAVAEHARLGLEMSEASSAEKSAVTRRLEQLETDLAAATSAASVAENRVKQLEEKHKSHSQALTDTIAALSKQFAASERDVQTQSSKIDELQLRLKRLSNVDATTSLVQSLLSDREAELARAREALDLASQLPPLDPQAAVLATSLSGLTEADFKQLLSYSACRLARAFVAELQQERQRRARLEATCITYAAHLSRCNALLESLGDGTASLKMPTVDPISDVVQLLNGRDLDLARKDDALVAAHVDLEAARLAVACVRGGSLASPRDGVASSRDVEYSSSLPSASGGDAGPVESEQYQFLKEKAATYEQQLRQRLHEFNVVKLERDLALARLATDTERDAVSHDAVIVADTSDLQLIMDCKEAELRILASRLDQRERSLAAVAGELSSLRRKVADLHEKLLAVEIKGAGSRGRPASVTSERGRPVQEVLSREPSVGSTDFGSSPQAHAPATATSVDTSSFVGANASRRQLEELLQLVKSLRKQNSVLHSVICDRSVALRHLAWLLASRKLLPLGMDAAQIGGDLSRELRLAFAERDAELQLKDQALLQRSTEVLVLEQNLLELHKQLSDLGKEPVRPLTDFSKAAMDASRAAQQEVIARQQSRAALHEQHVALQFECSEVESQSRLLEAQLKAMPADDAAAVGLRQELVSIRLRREELLGTLSVLDAQCAAHDQEVELLRQVLSQSTRMVQTMHQQKEVDNSFSLLSRLRSKIFGK